MSRYPVRDPEAGFTLIELLVVILIIAILAAIAIPVFFAQREKGYQAQIQSALKNAAIAVETFVMDQDDGYVDLHGKSGAGLEAALAPYGFTLPPWAGPNPARFEMEATVNGYCIEARHAQLTANSAWRTSTYWSTNPVPVPVPDACNAGLLPP